MGIGNRAVVAEMGILASRPTHRTHSTESTRTYYPVSILHHVSSPVAPIGDSREGRLVAGSRVVDCELVAEGADVRHHHLRVGVRRTEIQKLLSLVSVLVLAGSVDGVAGSGTRGLRRLRVARLAGGVALVLVGGKGEELLGLFVSMGLEREQLHRRTVVHVHAIGTAERTVVELEVCLVILAGRDTGGRRTARAGAGSVRRSAVARRDVRQMHLGGAVARLGSAVLSGLVTHLHIRGNHDLGRTALNEVRSRRREGSTVHSRRSSLGE